MRKQQDKRLHMKEKKSQSPKWTHNRTVTMCQGILKGDYRKITTPLQPPLVSSLTPSVSSAREKQIQITMRSFNSLANIQRNTVCFFAFTMSKYETFSRPLARTPIDTTGPIGTMRKTLEYQPWNNGRILQTETGPKLANCPSEHSRKNRGKPARASMIA